MPRLHFIVSRKLARLDHVRESEKIFLYIRALGGDLLLMFVVWLLWFLIVPLCRCSLNGACDQPLTELSFSPTRIFYLLDSVF